MAQRCEARRDPRNNKFRSNLRFSDVPTSIGDNLSPIEGYENCPLRPLIETVEPVTLLVSHVHDHARTAERSCRSTCPEGLTSNELAAIKIYTTEWEPQKTCLYFVLNQALRAKNRDKLKPWFSYLKLILTALFRLPSVQTTVYRGVKSDLHTEYSAGKTVVWWSFSSCTKHLDVLETEQFLGKTGVRTMFIINCSTGKDISNFSAFPGEGEILLLPATQLKVDSVLTPARDLHMVYLKEVPSSNIILEPPDKNINIYVESRIKDLLSAPLQSELGLTNKNLSDGDIAPLCKVLKSNVMCISLDLSSNAITSDGARYLSNALQTNRTLESLNLSENRLSDFGITNLAQGLELNRTLKKITLSSNQVTDIGVSALVDMLQQNQSIIYIDLCSNEISDDGMQHLIDLLVSGSSLNELILSGNKVTDSSVDKLVHMLCVNRSLTCLYLDANKLSDDGKEHIRSGTLRRDKLALRL